MPCLFCRIVDGAIPAQIVYSSPDVTAFRDINPQAPVHVLVIPNRHIESLSEIASDDWPIVGRLTEVTNQLARQEGIAEQGYRVVINNGSNAGQTVPHLHFHLLGGRPMTWPPG
jgi:histidine triad (HIT) family protein